MKQTSKKTQNKTDMNSVDDDVLIMEEEQLLNVRNYKIILLNLAGFSDSWSFAICGCTMGCGKVL